MAPFYHVESASLSKKKWGGNRATARECHEVEQVSCLTRPANFSPPPPFALQYTGVCLCPQTE